MAPVFIPKGDVTNKAATQVADLENIRTGETLPSGCETRRIHREGAAIELTNEVFIHVSCIRNQGSRFLTGVFFLLCVKCLTSRQWI